MKKNTIVKGLLAILALSMSSICWGTTPPAMTFRGQATAANVTLLGINMVLGDTGPLPTKGGALET